MKQVVLPHDASLYGHRVDAVLQYLTITTGVAFAIMASILLVAVVFHRGRARRAWYTHGNARSDRVIAVVAGAAVLFGIDAVAVVRSSESLRTGFWRSPDGDPRAIRVEVTARQWSWTFRLPGSDARFGTADDIVTLNELNVPVGQPVTMQLTSIDVVHSLYLPNFRTKIDAIPGTVTRLWFEARETGAFEIGCAQHCGAWHYKMRGVLNVMDAGSHARWTERAALDAALRGRAPVEVSGAGMGASSEAGMAGTGADAWTWNPPP